MSQPPFFPAVLSLIFLLANAHDSGAQISYNRPTARVVRNADGTRLNIKVDPHSQRVEEVLEDANKTVVWRIVTELDDALHPLRATKYDAQNNIVSRHRYLILRGRTEEEEIRDANDKFLSKLVFYYDTKGRMIRVEELNAQGTVVSVSRSSTRSGKSPSSESAPSTPSR